MQSRRFSARSRREKIEEQNLLIEFPPEMFFEGIMAGKLTNAFSFRCYDMI